MVLMVLMLVVMMMVGGLYVVGAVGFVGVVDLVAVGVRVGEPASLMLYSPLLLFFVSRLGKPRLCPATSASRR